MPFGTQIATRLPDGDVARLDALVEEGRYASRADAVRAAVATLLELERRRRVGQAIVDGYRRVPQTDTETAAAEANLRRLVSEEPW